MFAYYVFPEAGLLISEGMTAAASVADAGRMMLVFGAGFIVTLAGLVLFAIAIWNASERFPRWSGILVVIGFALLLIQTSYVIQILENILWGAAYLWMAAYSWQYFTQTS